jgi:peptide-methionine (S)-S-oxide reductase
MIKTILRALAGLGALCIVAVAPLAAEPAAQGQGAASQTQLEVATFGGGCFWCTQADFDKVPGVVATEVGFMGGRTRNPTYDEVAWGHTGHVEVVQVRFDPRIVGYGKLVDYYWRHVDVLDGRGQFSDRGAPYRPVIFTHSAEQQRIAEASKAALDGSKRFAKPVAVKIEPASDFTPAEGVHQKFYTKNTFRYKFYRLGSGRDARLRQLWGDEAM